MTTVVPRVSIIHFLFSTYNTTISSKHMFGILHLTRTECVEETKAAAGCRSSLSRVSISRSVVCVDSEQQQQSSLRVQQHLPCEAKR